MAKRRKAAAKPPIQIVVRVGALKRFDAFKRKTADLPVVVSWDRRKGERRTKGSEVARNRRQTDRRGRPPSTWELADFVVVERPPRRGGRRS